MSQTIDLREKGEPPKIPRPPEEEEIKPVIEPVTIIETQPVVFKDPIQESDIRWSTHLSPPHNRNQTLYITIGLIISAGLIAYFTHDFLFTTILILSAIVLNLNAIQPHRQSEITVHATGVSIDDQSHHYADMKSFWVEYQPNLKELSIELKKGYAPRIKIPLEDANPLEIRRAMLSYIPEKEHEQSLLDHVVRLIGI